MKSLKEYINEASALDTEGNLNMTPRQMEKRIKEEIKEFLIDLYDNGKACKISNKPNSDGLFEVTCVKPLAVRKFNTTTLTNGKFVFVQAGDFACKYCEALESLEGAPKHCKKFVCWECASLKNFVGGPEIVDDNFSFSGKRGANNALESLEGAPTQVRGSFGVSYCNNLKSIEGMPETIGGDVFFKESNSLKSLKGFAKSVGGGVAINSEVLNSLDGMPSTVNGQLTLSDCPKLKSLDPVTVVNGDLLIRNSGMSHLSKEDFMKMGIKISGTVYN